MRAELLLVGTLLLSNNALAAFATTWEADYDDEGKWKEVQAQIPPYPKGSDLIAFEPGGSAAHKYYVDPASVSVGEDGVVRYTSVVKAAGGGVNVTFEGMRCDTREGKLYAIGRADGTWTRAKNAKWQRIVLRNEKPYPYVLYRDYFCASPARPTPVKLALDALRRGQSLGPTNRFDE